MTWRQDIAYKQICGRPIKQPAAYCQLHKQQLNNAKTSAHDIIFLARVALEAEELMESLHSGIGSSSEGGWWEEEEERVVNAIIPPQSRPEVTLPLAGRFAYEMVHEQRYSAVWKGAPRLFE